MLFFHDNAITGAATHPDDALCTRVLTFTTQTNYSNNEHDVRERDQGNVAPEAQIFRHPYFASAFVAMPTFMIFARCNASINMTSFCTGKSRSGRITTATSGLARLISARRALSDSRSTS